MKQTLLTLLFFSLTACVSCSKKPQGFQMPPAPVTAAVVTQKDVPVQIEAVGGVEAHSTVSVKSLVAGQIVQVHFKEGDYVKKGEMLFTIDPRPFEISLAKDTALVRQAEANLQKDAAQAKNAESEARRYKDLIAKGYVSQEQYDQVKANDASAKATVLADEAALRVDINNAHNSRLQWQYCFIKSPIDGRTGSLLVHQGNLVKANDTPNLVVINQVQPIYVTFAVPQEHLDEIKEYMARGDLKVEASVAGRVGKPVIGQISFIDNSVDLNTGTVKLKGVFANEDKTLWPGEFAKVALTLRTEHNVAVVPSQAVQTGQQGSYVFAIKPDMTAEVRPVTVDRTFGSESVIKTGLRPGEKVVTDGQLRLAPGMKVLLLSTTGG